jgi:FKBP-type peptidyl-prolyl cis-trans isomerase SlyD
MQIEENRVVTLAYELRNGSAEGEVMEIMNEKYPFEFLFGTGALLKSFEQNLKGLEEGQEFSFTLRAEEAYGFPRPDEIIDVPINAFMVDGKIPENLLTIGEFVTLTDDLGENHTGKIISFSDTQVKVDFNHVMVGKDLHFIGTVLKVRNASVDELIRKHHIPQV